MENKVIEATIFIRPNGKKEIIVVPKVYPDDADYINQNKIKVSMEDIGGEYCVWFDDGLKDHEGNPDEIIVLVQGRTCEETIKEGVELLKIRKQSINER